MASHLSQQGYEPSSALKLLVRWANASLDIAFFHQQKTSTVGNAPFCWTRVCSHYWVEYDIIGGWNCTEAQYERIAPMVSPAANAATLSMSNLQVLNAGFCTSPSMVAQGGACLRGLAPGTTVLYPHEPLVQKRSASIRSVRTPSSREQIVRMGNMRGSGFGGSARLSRCIPMASGACKKNGPQSIGKSRGGWTTKIHMVVRRCSNGSDVLPLRRTSSTTRLKDASCSTVLGHSERTCL